MLELQPLKAIHQPRHALELVCHVDIPLDSVWIPIRTQGCGDLSTNFTESVLVPWPITLTKLQNDQTLGPSRKSNSLATLVLLLKNTLASKSEATKGHGEISLAKSLNLFSKNLLPTPNGFKVMTMSVKDSAIQ